MRPRLIVFGLGLAPLLATLGCSGSDPMSPSSMSSYLVASLSGAIDGSYTGSGTFHAGVDPRQADRPLIFSLTSHGTTGSAGGQAFQLFRADGGAPEPGVYALGLKGADFHATFHRAAHGGALIEAYAARSGELRITSATPERIQGTFRFHGFRYCARQRTGSGSPEGSCEVPDAPLQHAPTIDVSGSFSAAAFRGEAIPAQELNIGVVEHYGEPVVAQIPASVARGTAFSIQVITYGDGCTTEGRTQVETAALRAVVTPYDYRAKAHACPEMLRMLQHTAVLRFDQAGSATVVVRGRSQPSGEIITVEHTVLVR